MPGPVPTSPLPPQSPSLRLPLGRKASFWQRETQPGAMSGTSLEYVLQGRHGGGNIARGNGIDSNSSLINESRHNVFQQHMEGLLMVRVRIA